MSITCVDHFNNFLKEFIENICIDTIDDNDYS